MNRTFFWTILICTALPVMVHSQEELLLKEHEETLSERGPTLNIGADFMSRYIWRGIDFGNSPAIQPNIYFSWQGLNIGTWGSYAFSAQSIRINDTTVENIGHYSEMDLYICYTLKWFTLMVFDYFTIDGLNANEGNRYFDYNNNTTGHTFEISFTFDGPEKCPLQFIAATLVYGADKNKDTLGIYGSGDKNNFSTYFELAYNFNFPRIGLEMRPFIGGTPFGSSWYGPHAGFTL